MSAALGLPMRRGTSQTVSVSTTARHESLQPWFSSSDEKTLRSAALTAADPLATRTRHLPQVPMPPQVLSMASPIQLAALKMEVPGGTRVSLSCGWNSI
jgi:hypothetical protein